MTEIVTVGRDGVSGPIDHEIAQLEALLADLKRIKAGERPTAAELDAAPIIDAYELSVRAEPCLVGTTHGHPRLGSRLVMTSGLWAWSPELGWARTLSRFYRLGRPVGQERQS